MIRDLTAAFAQFHDSAQPFHGSLRPLAAEVKRERELRLVNWRCISDNLDNSDSLDSGAMVQRLARGPFKAEIRVRFPLALPDSLLKVE